MTDADQDFPVYLTQTTRGTFIAATNDSPYFCIEAESEEAVLNRVRDALAFYQQNKSTWIPSPTDELSITRFITQRVLRSEELTRDAA